MKDPLPGETQIWHRSKVIPPDIQDMPEYKRFMRTAEVLCKDIRCPCCGQLEYNRVDYYDPPV